MKKESLHVITFRNGTKLSLTIDGTMAKLDDVVKNASYPVDELAELFASFLPATNGAPAGRRGEDRAPRRQRVTAVSKFERLRWKPGKGPLLDVEKGSKLERVASAAYQLTQSTIGRGSLELALVKELGLTRQQVTAAVSHLLHNRGVFVVTPADGGVA